MVILPCLGGGREPKRDHTLEENTGAEATLNDLDDTAIQNDRQSETHLLLFCIYTTLFI